MRAQHTPDHGIPPEPKAAKGASGLYLATWAVLAAAASGYMGILLLQPEWAAPLTTQSLRTEEPKPASTEVVEQLTGEIHFLRTRVADLQRELTEVKSTAAAKHEVAAIRDDVLAAITPPPAPVAPEPQLAETDPDVPDILNAQTAEPRLRTTQTEAPGEDVRLLDVAQSEARPEAEQDAAGQPRVKIVNATQPRERQPEPEAELTADLPRRDNLATVAAPPAPPPVPVKKVAVLDSRPSPITITRAVPIVTNPSRPALPLATGSLPPPEPQQITFGPATVTPASEAYAIHLDAGPSVDALRLRWSVLHDRHQSALRDLEPRYLVGGSPAAPSYELLAGPIDSAEEASRICALLRARGVTCTIGGPFAGEAL